MIALALTTLAMVVASPPSQPAERPQPTVSAKTFNRVQRQRRELGQRVELVTEPKLIKTYRLVKRKLKARRALCKRTTGTGVASWYGPGLYGSALAFGGQLDRGDVHFAHKTWPSGYRVYFHLNGRTVRAPVRDRGPYVAGRDFDFTEALKNKLGGFANGGFGTVTYSRVRCWR